ncbi:MAG TPA: hypothetical protein PLQ88_06735, partial [Blastocatellia bacterium]|nr:hypothetical protein [Blastocatellia bacterium]
TSCSRCSKTLRARHRFASSCLYLWDGWGIPAETWGILALLAAGAIASAVTALPNGNAPFALTVIWALIAVAVNQFTQAVTTNSITVGAIAAGLTFLTGVTLLVASNRQ